MAQHTGSQGWDEYPFHGIGCQVCRIRLFLALGFSEDYIETVLNMCE
jgi:hypothetical protein